MTNIHLVYDPYADKVQVYIESREITAPENKIYSFLDLNGFYKCLLPFRRRYAIWEGLLLELLEEVNDEDLHIIFEGRRTDHQRLAEAFRQMEPAVENAGYENRWQLTYKQNFESADFARRLAKTAKDLREMCECRAELSRIDNFIAGIREESVVENCRQFRSLLSEHIVKWEQGNSAFKQEKIAYLSMMEEGIAEVGRQLEGQRSWV